MRIVYQVHGDGPRDVLLLPGFASNVEYLWEMPVFPRLLDWIASYARVIYFDKRGTGCSDPVHELPTIDDRVDDLRAVMDAAGAERVGLLGISEGGPAAIRFAAQSPERAERLLLCATTARMSRAPDWPEGVPPELIERLADRMHESWGEDGHLEHWAPSAAADPVLDEAWRSWLRRSASPAMGRALLRSIKSIDVREDARRVRAPALVLHRARDRILRAGTARATAELIPGARYVELPGEDHLPFTGDWQRLGREWEQFFAGGRAGAGPAGRELLTVLFTDIASSTERAARDGDSAWRDLISGQLAAAERESRRFGGRLVKSTGDGVLAVFPRPRQAIDAARELLGAAAGAGIGLRAGIHTGECETLGDDVAGMTVNLAARICAAAEPDEILVSSTVRELLVGDGLSVDDRGEHELKGVPGSWRLHAVVS